MAKDPENKTFLKLKDHAVSGKKFELILDEELQLLKTFPKPELEELPEFYESENYISHTDSTSSWTDRLYQRVKILMIRQKLEWIEEVLNRKGTLLDIGAGTGDFMVGARNKGWNTEGVEPSSVARKRASGKNIELKEETSKFPESYFDVITMWHVLEHVPDPETQILEMDRILKSDGLIVVAVPNYKSFDAKKYEEFWAAYDVPRHLWHFSETSIKKIFSRHGFEVVKSKGLIFDSFYVSILSEKYRTGNRNFLRGFFFGLVSNLSAVWTGEFSSAAYFIRKKS